MTMAAGPLNHTIFTMYDELSALSPAYFPTCSRCLLFFVPVD
jgi:hypothetical protein